jgi:hypothetical protein
LQIAKLRRHDAAGEYVETNRDQTTCFLFHSCHTGVLATDFTKVHKRFTPLVCVGTETAPPVLKQMTPLKDQNSKAFCDSPNACHQ